MSSHCHGNASLSKTSLSLFSPSRFLLQAILCNRLTMYTKFSLEGVEPVTKSDCETDVDYSVDGHQQRNYLFEYAFPRQTKLMSNNG